MPKNAVVSNLLEIVKTEVSRLKGKRSISLEKYLGDWEIQHIVERSFQQAIQSCIDIGARIISQESFSAPDDYHGIFEILFQEKIIPFEFTQKMKEMVGFRNALIHEYRRIKHEEVYRHLQESTDVFLKFSRYILDFLERSSTVTLHMAKKAEVKEKVEEKKEEHGKCPKSKGK